MPIPFLGNPFTTPARDSSSKADVSTYAHRSQGRSNNLVAVEIPERSARLTPRLVLAELLQRTRTKIAASTIPTMIPGLLRADLVAVETEGTSRGRSAKIRFGGGIIGSRS
jgi:hypothetical protein